MTNWLTAKNLIQLKLAKKLIARAVPYLCANRGLPP
jgi:hypothetical protein